MNEEKIQELKNDLVEISRLINKHYSDYLIGTSSDYMQLTSYAFQKLAVGFDVIMLHEKLSGRIELQSTITIGNYPLKILTLI